MIFFLTAAIWALPSPALTVLIRLLAPFLLLYHSKGEPLLEKLKPCQCNAISSEILLLIHLLFKLELNQYIDGDSSWSSLFMLEAEQAPRAVTLNAGFLWVLEAVIGCCNIF